MASTLLFIVMAIIAGLLLLTSGISAAIAAADSFNSIYYNTNSKIRSAHQYLTIAAALGISAFVVLVVILIIAAIAGGFTTAEISDAVLSKPNLSRSDLLAIYKGEKELSSGGLTQIIVLIILIIVSLITLAVGILSVIGAVELGTADQRDDNASSAYVAAIVAAVAGLGGVGIMIVAVVTYYSIRSARVKELNKFKAAENRAEAQLGITGEQLAEQTGEEV